MSEKMETGLTGWPAGAAWRQRKALRPQPWASAGERTVSTPRRRRGGGDGESLFSIPCLCYVCLEYLLFHAKMRMR